MRAHADTYISTIWDNLEHLEQFGTYCIMCYIIWNRCLRMFYDSIMPKNGPSAEEWKEKLCAFAKGEFQFRKRQMQAKGNHWGKMINTIRKCPLFKSAGMRRYRW